MTNQERQAALPDEPRQVLEATRFFTDQLAFLVERVIPNSEVVAAWRKFSLAQEKKGFWGPPLSQKAVTSREVFE